MPETRPSEPARPKPAIDLFAVFAYVLVAGTVVAQFILLATLS